MQAENEIHGLLIGSASVIGDNTEQRLGSCFDTEWERPVKEKKVHLA
ncbi:MAG: hypothetical protein NZ522_04140 [Chitinophagales bacterium]|nr:hypothetical protein [Chitinophagales bacterium]